MTVADQIALLDLADDVGGLHAAAEAAGVRFRDVMDDTAPKPADTKASVVAGVLMSFVDGVGPQEKEDVLYSVQLAYRAASKAFDRIEQTEKWFGRYTEVLTMVGWTVEATAQSHFGQDQGKLRMDKAALAVITQIAVGNQLTVLTTAIGALGKLGKDDEPITLFKYYTAVKDSGNFQLGAVQRSGNGALSMALGAFQSNAIDNAHGIAFFDWSDASTKFWSAAHRMTLNVADYARHRDKVIKQLGASADEYIAALAL